MALSGGVCSGGDVYSVNRFPDEIRVRVWAKWELLPFQTAVADGNGFGTPGFGRLLVLNPGWRRWQPISESTVEVDGAAATGVIPGLGQFAYDRKGLAEVRDTCGKGTLKGRCYPLALSPR